MKTTFTREFIEQNKGCYTLKQINELSFINNKPITLKDIIECEDLSNNNKYWFLINNCNFNSNTKLECYKQSTKLQELSVDKGDPGGGWFVWVPNYNKILY